MSGRLVWWWSWVALLGFDTAAQLAFKLGSDRLVGVSGGEWLMGVVTSPWVLAWVAGSLGSFVAWMAILRQSDLSLAFPMSGFAYVTVLLASHLVLGESVAVTQWLGVGCIVGGFLVMIGE